ncbi:MAG: CsbD family protein [Afipia sp.]
MDKDRITGAAKDAAGKVERAFGRAAGDTATEASGRAREAGGTVQNLYGQAKDAARDIGDTANRYAQDAADAGSEVYRDGSRAVASAVQNQPLGALLVAGAVGFALALMLNRQPTRRRTLRNYS